MRFAKAIGAGWMRDGDVVIHVPIGVWRGRFVPRGAAQATAKRERGERVMTPVAVVACFIVGVLAGRSFASCFR